MKKPVQLDLSITQNTKKNKPIQVQSWVNKALDAKKNPKKNKKSGSMLEINMSFRKPILDLR